MLERNRFTFALAAGAMFFAAATPQASAAPVAFQNGLGNAYVVGNYAGTSDTELNSAPNGANPGYINGNAGGSDFMRVNQTRTNEEAKALIRFDLSSLAGQNLQVNSASLILRPLTGGSSDNIQVSLHEISAANAGWIQGTSTRIDLEPSAGSATWANKAHPGTPWAGSAGLKTPGTDFVSTAAATGVYDPTSSAPLTFALANALVQGWVDNPSANAGLLMLTDVGASSLRFAQFFTSEVTNSSLRPTLVVDVTPIPEPGTLALLGGSILLIPRRNRCK